jgi:Glycosyl transferase family 2
MTLRIASSSDLRPLPRTVVAIPAKNEAERIGACLFALAGLTVKPAAVVVLANNCTDGTVQVARALSAGMPYQLLIDVHTFPPPSANAGSARRMAAQHAADLAGGNGVVLTTDADAVVAGNWIERNLLALSAGADLVCGRVTLARTEAALIPSHLHADDALECELTELLDRIADRLDPDPADPWPRHTETAGASLAVTVAAFDRVGGIPALAFGEDRAFVQALASMDASIRHDPTVAVTVSGRTVGRASGGMADTIRRRIQRQDEFTDCNLEPATDAYRRIDFRRRVRMAWQKPSRMRAISTELAADLGIAAPTLQLMLRQRHFGAAWAAVQAASPFLVRRRVRFTDLPGQIAYARQLLEMHTDREPFACWRERFRTGP